MISEFTTMDILHSNDFQDSPILVSTSAFANPDDDEEELDPEPNKQEAENFDEFSLADDNENVAGVKNPT